MAAKRTSADMPLPNGKPQTGIPPYKLHGTQRCPNNSSEVPTTEIEELNKDLAIADSDMKILLNSSLIAFIILDSQLKIKRYSSQAAKIFNLIPSDVGRSFKHFTGKLDYSGLYQDTESVLNTLTPIEKEACSFENLWFLVRIAPCRTTEKVIEGVILTITDVNESKQDRIRLGASEKRLQALVTASSDVVYSMNPDWSIMLRLSSKNYLSTTEHPNCNWLRDYIPEEERERVLETIHNAIETKSLYELQHKVRQKDGSIGWTHSRAVPLMDKHGNIYEWFGMAKDITEIKNAELALNQSEVKFRQLADSMPQMVWSAQPDGTIDYINKRFSEFKWLDQRPDGSWEVTETIHPEDRERTLKSRENALLEGNPYQIEHRLRCHGGSYRWFLTRCIPIYDQNGEVVKWYGTTTDIEDLKQTEEALYQARLAAESAAQAKSEFLANMTHEIRTPMTVILGALQHLDKSKLSADEAYCLDLAEKAGDNLLELIGDILDFSKIEAGRIIIEKGPFDLYELITNVTSLYQIKTKEKKLTLDVKISKKVPQIFIGDESRLRQVLVNLIGNAVKFTKQGSVTVHVDCQPSEGSEKSPDARLLVRVSDTGCGIPEDKKDLLFQSFSQVDSSITRRFGGTGLGLAICKGIIGNMGGNIWVESQENQGSSFFFSIPMSLKDSYLSGQTTQSFCREEKELSRHLRILIAEDDPAVREMLRIALNRSEWQVKMVTDGSAVVSAWAEGDFDLILMDLQMGDVDGITATRQIRSREKPGQHVPIVALTALVSSQTRGNCLAAGMDDVLTKPVQFQMLEDIIGRFCEEGCLQ